MAATEHRIFAGFDLQDATSIAQFVIAFLYWQDGGRDPHNPAVECLGLLGRESIRVIVGRVDSDPGFADMIQSLLETVLNDDIEINIHGSDLICCCCQCCCICCR